MKVAILGKDHTRAYIEARKLVLSLGGHEAVSDINGGAELAIAPVIDRYIVAGGADIRPRSTEHLSFIRHRYHTVAEQVPSSGHISVTNQSRPPHGFGRTSTKWIAATFASKK